MKGEKVNERLKRLRTSILGWTQTKMANYLGCHVRSYRNWETGALPLSDVQCLEKLADLYGVSTDFILCRVSEIPAHGRLIDADEIEADMQQLWIENEISNSDWIGFREVLNGVSTIIPATMEVTFDALGKTE